MGLWNAIVDAVMAIWDYIKHIFKQVLQFTAHIVGFFKNPDRLRKLKQDRNLIALAVKENLENGRFNTISCLYDKSSNEVIDMEEDAQGIESEQLDDETLRNFGDKPMVVLS